MIQREDSKFSGILIQSHKDSFALCLKYINGIQYELFHNVLDLANDVSWRLPCTSSYNPPDLFTCCRDCHG